MGAAGSALDASGAEIPIRSNAAQGEQQGDDPVEKIRIPPTLHLSRRHRPPTLAMDLHQGDCIRLHPEALAAQPPHGRLPERPGPESEPLFQVIGVDRPGERCWVRRWPLARRGSPVFEVALHQVQGQAPHRPLPQARHES